MLYAAEALRALRQVSRLGLSGSAIIDEFGLLEAVSFERLLLWAFEKHDHVLAD